MAKRKRLSNVKKNLKAKRNNAGSRKKTFPGEKVEYFTLEQVVTALQKTGGIKSAAARLLKKQTGRGCGKGPIIDHYIKRHPELAVVLEQIEDGNTDIAESKLLKAIKDEKRKDHLSAVIFFLRTKGKHRGYTSRTEMTGADGGPVRHTVERLDLSKLDDDELDTLNGLFSKASSEVDGHPGTSETEGQAEYDTADKRHASRRRNGVYSNGEVKP